MRAFIGIRIPESLTKSITQLQEEFSGLDVKLVEPQNFHFNLKFFKEISESLTKELESRLRESLKGFKKFRLRISGLGVFPNKRYVRVIWLGVKDGYDNTLRLARLIESCCSELGFRREKKFIPHLTLGRVRSGRQREGLLRVVEKLEGVEIGEMMVEEIVFFESKLTPKGPIYTQLFSVELES